MHGHVNVNTSSVCWTSIDRQRTVEWCGDACTSSRCWSHGVLSQPFPCAWSCLCWESLLQLLDQWWCGEPLQKSNVDTKIEWDRIFKLMFTVEQTYTWLCQMLQYRGFYPSGIVPRQWECCPWYRRWNEIGTGGRKLTSDDVFLFTVQSTLHSKKAISSDAEKLGK